MTTTHTHRVAYITGGMGGIGTALCRRLCKEGHTVIAGCGPGSPRREKWIRDMTDQGYKVICSEGNVADWESTRRAFEIVDLRPYTSPDQKGKPAGHGLALLRKRHGHFSAADIDELAPNEPREIRALQHNLRQLSNEVIQLRQQLAEV